ncbi:MAG: hypothetical protein EA397_11870 [Deltaproteobacteria bacterium]|nr:MAG: hypothetical protein EA397_11870 [Deltaproteobacteria bacterium]
MRLCLPLLCFLASPAFASWPGDLAVSRMGEHDGAPVAPEVTVAGFEQIARGLAATVANKPVAPARTLGAAGFDVSFGLTTALLDRGSPTDGDPSGWDLARIDGDAPPFLAIPTLSLRKGLPGSVEVGAAGGWIAGTRQGVFSTFARAAPLEGYEKGPDLAFQLGYATYIGNPELSLGTFDLTATLGGTFPFASDDEIAAGTFSPYLGGGLLLFHARAHLEPSLRDALLGTSSRDDPATLPLTPLPTIQGGFQITNHSVLVRLAVSYTATVGPSAHAGMGFAY